jgi:hypothetical protein
MTADDPSLVGGLLCCYSSFDALHTTSEFNTRSQLPVERNKQKISIVWTTAPTSLAIELHLELPHRYGMQRLDPLSQGHFFPTYEQGATLLRVKRYLRVR